MSSVFVGVDLGVAAPHQAWAVGPGRKKLGEKKFAHLGGEIRGFVDWILALVDSPGDLIVGLESPHGPVVEELLAHEIAVYHLNPKQLDHYRQCDNVAGAKDDRRDARLLAERLLTDLHSYRRVQPAGPIYVQLREASREREGLVSALRATCNRLRDELHRLSPRLLSLCPAADERWLWDLLELYPTPREAKGAKRGKVREVLKARRIRRHSLEEVIKALQGRGVSVAPGLTDAAHGKILRLVRRALSLDESLREVNSELKSLLQQLTTEEEASGNKKQRDAAVLLSMPGVGDVIGATLLGEATEALRQRDYQALRAVAGVAPVTVATGKRSRSKAKVKMRYACNSRLRNALHHMARVASQRDLAAKAHLRACLDRGHTLGRALRSVADRLLRILVAALRAGTLYDPSRQTGVYAQAAQVAATHALTLTPCA